MNLFVQAIVFLAGVVYLFTTWTVLFELSASARWLKDHGQTQSRFGMAYRVFMALAHPLWMWSDRAHNWVHGKRFD